MQRAEPPHPPQPASDAPDAPPARGKDATLDALGRLEQRLDRASDAAERLAQATVRTSSRPPPAGWQPADADRGTDTGDPELLVQVVQSLRELVPPELQRGLAEALHELLLALRALIDWYLEHVERPPTEPVEVQDIPIL